MAAAHGVETRYGASAHVAIQLQYFMGDLAGDATTPLLELHLAT